MVAIANATAVAAATPGSAIDWAQNTPIRAETKLPAMIDQGWASGLAGAANSSTAEAPMGAMNHGLALPSAWCPTHSVQNSPTSAPTAP